MTAPNLPALVDPAGRRIFYLRMSVTDRCDLRCRYCLPERPEFLPRSGMLSLPQLLLAAEVFASRGISKIRITGGEPLARRNLIWMIERICTLPGLKEATLTTNGTRLGPMAADLRAAGISRINVSLDTLDPDKFSRLTRTGDLQRVRAGLAAAVAARFERIRINTVLMKGFNDDELCDLVEFADGIGADISFIEEMPLGDLGAGRRQRYLGAPEALALLSRRLSLTESDYSSGGPASYWQLAGSPTRVGFIAPHSRNFCASCNRMRMTCTGDLYPCLGHNGRVELGEAIAAGDRKAISAGIDRALAGKPDSHRFNPAAAASQVMRYMATTGG